MFDTEKFILLIESNPCIWDIASQDYMDRNVKNTCWLNIAESMYTGNWCELSNAQKNENGNYYINKFILVFYIDVPQINTNLRIACVLALFINAYFITIFNYNN